MRRLKVVLIHIIIVQASMLDSGVTEASIDAKVSDTQ